MKARNGILALLLLGTLALSACSQEKVQKYYVQETSTGWCYEVEETRTTKRYMMIECDIVPDGVDIRVVEVWEGLE